jgi:hypothetical protein
MSNIALSGNASGTGTFTIASPNSNTNRTLNLPDASGAVIVGTQPAGDVVGTTATQTLTNKTIQGGAITQATAVASTSGTSIDFTGIPSWVKRITVMLNGVSTNGASAYQIQLGDAGGIETTGYVASTQFVSTTTNTTRGTLFASGFGLSWSTGAAGDFNTATLTFVNVSANNWNGTGMQNYSVGGGHFITGQKTLSDTLDRIRVTTVNGTDVFDAGIINILYEG